MVNVKFFMDTYKDTPFPDDLLALGEDEIRKIWHGVKLSKFNDCKHKIESIFHWSAFLHI